MFLKTQYFQRQLPACLRPGAPGTRGIGPVLPHEGCPADPHHASPKVLFVSNAAPEQPGRPQAAPPPTRPGGRFLPRAAPAALRAPGGELSRCGLTGPVSASSPENEGTVSTRLPSARDHDIHGPQRETSELLAFLNAQVRHGDTVLNESQKQPPAHWNATAHQKPTGSRPRRERRGTFLWANPAPRRGTNRDATWLRPWGTASGPSPMEPRVRATHTAATAVRQRPPHVCPVPVPASFPSASSRPAASFWS